MLDDIFLALWFFLPAGFANGAAVLPAHIPGLRTLDAPMDFGHRFRGKRIFGPHKTWRGLITGVIVATLTLWLQQYLVVHSAWLAEVTAPVDYASLPVLLVGPLFAVGALGGDALKSFFKRQRGIPAGKSWFPYDQLDYIIGTVVVLLPFIRLSLVEYFWIFVVWWVAHVVISYISYRVGWKERPI
jgi:CDP-2,3-bis-(O-geranylgeranyl)-sn-glycerol synthase